MRLPQSDWLVDSRGQTQREFGLSSGRNIGIGYGVVFFRGLHLDTTKKPRSQLTDQLETSTKNQNTQNSKLHNILKIQIFWHSSSGQKLWMKIQNFDDIFRKIDKNIFYQIFPKITLQCHSRHPKLYISVFKNQKFEFKIFQKWFSALFLLFPSSILNRLIIFKIVYAHTLVDVITIFYQCLTKFDPTVFLKKMSKFFWNVQSTNFWKILLQC